MFGGGRRSRCGTVGGRPSRLGRPGATASLDRPACLDLFQLPVVFLTALWGPKAVECGVDPHHRPGRSVAGDIGVVATGKVAIRRRDRCVVFVADDPQGRVGVVRHLTSLSDASTALYQSALSGHMTRSGRRLRRMAALRVLDIADDAAFGRVPPCADPGFDHRSCDYWEDADRGSKAARLAWLEPGPGSRPEDASARPRPANPFLADLEAAGPAPSNPFATAGRANPAFLTPGDDDEPPVANPFAPAPVGRPRFGADAPRKLQLLGRGLGVAGSYAKILLRDDVPVVYAQFGPLTAYPRAQRTRDLYPSLPDAPLPAVITCIATTSEARGAGLARSLVAVVCEDLAGRGFTAVETYPTIGAERDATSAATPAFWESVGFSRAIDDERFPVMRREFG